MPEAPFQVLLLPEARDQLGKLDPPLAARVWDKLLWLGTYARQIQHLPLSNDLAGLCKRRVGAYRIIYELQKDESRIVVYRIAHRREIYGGS